MKPLITAALLLYGGCETVNFGVSYQGQYGTYTATRRMDYKGPAHWDVLVSADGKRIVPFER